MELFQKIEALTNQKMEQYPADQDTALLLLDRVNEAQRIATMQVSVGFNISMHRWAIDVNGQCLRLAKRAWRARMTLFMSTQMREIDKGKGGKRKGRGGRDEQDDDVGGRTKFKRKY